MTSSIARARLRLLPLVAAVFARALGANAVRVFVFLSLIPPAGAFHPLSVIFLWLCMTAVPAFALAPLIGALASSKLRQATLILCTLIGLGVIGLGATQVGPWESCLGVLAMEGAFFAAGRQTLVPIAARPAQVSFPRLQALLAGAVGAGALVGIGIGLRFNPVAPVAGMPEPVLAGLIGYAAAALALLFVRYMGEGDTPLTEGMVKPFLSAFREVARTRNARNTFLALGGWFLLTLLFLYDHGWLMTEDELYSFGLALLVGVLLGGLHFHPYRTLGLVPFALLVLFGASIYNLASGDWHGPVWLSGIVLGVLFPPLVTVYQASLYPRSWGHASAILFAWFALLAAGFAGLLHAFRPDFARLPETAHNLRFGLVALLTLFAWLVFLRPAIETAVEILFLPIYRLKKVGPGADAMPWKGPCLVICNHGAMLDPLWISKFLPLPTTPMMTSKFYDLPVISCLMRRVVGTIRVPDKLYRREAPEIQEAIAALDRDEGVVIFPEGWLRRKDEVPLRRFGRGTWQILHARPKTPVFSFWIEGNWGSFFSWKGGALMKGKPLDFWRPIWIAGIEGRVVPPEVLENHLATRAELMKWVLEARALLGLPPLQSVPMPREGDEEEKESPSPPGPLSHEGRGGA
jgi:acyl-[acyl-carrier-protein]-phospholipid O-acyltransferase / long-chain-fatty-acid--[acyl-carrier-protein] ligase